MDYKITNDSKLEANRLYGECINNGTTIIYAFSVALDALCVPIQGHSPVTGICKHCGWPIYLQMDGIWYHNETTSIYCGGHPSLGGFSRDYKATPKVDWVADHLNDYTKDRQVWHRGDYTLNRWKNQTIPGPNWTVMFFNGKSFCEIALNNDIINLFLAKKWADGVVYRHKQGK